MKDPLPMYLLGISPWLARRAKERRRAAIKRAVIRVVQYAGIAFLLALWFWFVFAWQGGERP